jgi:hypothetical protein
VLLSQEHSDQSGSRPERSMMTILSCIVSGKPFARVLQFLYPAACCVGQTEMSKLPSLRSVQNRGWHLPGVFNRPRPTDNSDASQHRRFLLNELLPQLRRHYSTGVGRRASQRPERRLYWKKIAGKCDKEVRSDLNDLASQRRRLPLTSIW